MSTPRPDLSDFEPDLSDFTPEASQGTPPPSGNEFRRAETGPKAYAENLLSDIQSGTTITPVGRFLRSLGATGTRSGVSEGTGAMMAGPLEGVPRLAHGFLLTQQSRVGQPSQLVRGLNEMAAGAGQTLAPVAAATNPEFLPMAAQFSVGQKAGSKLAGALGASPETAELAGNLAGVGTLGALPKIGQTTNPVGLRGKAQSAFANVESQIGDQHVPFESTLDRAYKAMEMNAKGYPLPPVVARFVDWVQAVKSSQTPFRFQDARDFYTALGEAVPWEQFGGKGGKMFRQVKAMRQSLGDSLQDVANQNNVGEQYGQALKDYRSASQFIKGAKTAGSVLTLGPLGRMTGIKGGDIAASLARRIADVGGPNFETPSQPISGQLVRSVTGPGLSNLDIENIVRRAPGTEAEQQAIQSAIERAAERARSWRMTKGVAPNAPVSSMAPEPQGVQVSDPRFANTQAGTSMGTGGDPLTQKAFQMAQQEMGTGWKPGLAERAQQILEELKRRQ